MPTKLTKSQLRIQLIPLHTFAEDTSKNVPGLRSLALDILVTEAKGSERFCLWYDTIIHGLRYLNAQFKAAGLEVVDDSRWRHISPEFAKAKPQFDSPKHAGDVIESRLKLFAGFFDFCREKVQQGAIAE